MIQASHIENELQSKVFVRPNLYKAFLTPLLDLTAAEKAQQAYFLRDIIKVFINYMYGIKYFIAFFSTMKLELHSVLNLTQN